MQATSKSFRSLGTLPPQAAAKVKAAAKAAAPLVNAVQPDEAAPAPAVEHPGVERWPVKTGTDADAAKVGVNTIDGSNLGPGIVDTTVEEMLALPRPANMPPVRSSFALNSFYQDRRAAPTETTVWRLKAEVTEAKLEQDGDYHLVLKGTSGTTMIGEIPDPDPTYVQNAVWRADIKLARDEMDKKVGRPLRAVDFNPADMGVPTHVRTAPVPDQSAAMTKIGAQATVTGVGFFDSDHGQAGVAPATAIELHPIFSIVFD
jgi:hypothetical protein